MSQLRCVGSGNKLQRKKRGGLLEFRRRKGKGNTPGERRGEVGKERVCSRERKGPQYGSSILRGFICFPKAGISGKVPGDISTQNSLTSQVWPFRAAVPSDWSVLGHRVIIHHSWS